MSKHTPGPWEHDMQFIVCPDSSGLHHDLYVAEIVQEDEEGRCVDEDQQDANARLIAAAPELLEALLECVTDDGAHCMTDESRNSASIARRRLDEITRIARAAIAKAVQS